MTSTQHPEPQRSTYDSCDPQYLRELREAAGMDVFVLARTACLSVAQVRQLESNDGHDLFYSDAIKRQAYKRLLMILGAEPPTVEVPDVLRDAAKVADAHLNTLDQIVAMSSQPTMERSTKVVLSSGISKLKDHKQAVSALLLLVAAIALFVMHGPQSAYDAALQSSLAGAVASTSAAAPIQANDEPRVVAPLPLPQSTVSVASSPASVPVAPVVSAPVALSASAATTSAAALTCAYVSDDMPVLTPFIAQKEGRYVYLVSTSNSEVCVIDGNKQATVLQMKAGESRSVYGVSPWQVSSGQLSKIQVYFQGGRVTVPDAVSRVKLLEVPVAR